MGSKKDELAKSLGLMKLEPLRSASEEALYRQYDFWSTQPVPKMDEVITTNEPIEPDVAVERIRKDPYTLPTGFVWDDLDLEDEAVLKELYKLLSENYAEDDDCLFRYDYSPDFLKWALKPPGWAPEWHCGVRVAKNRKLVGFIAAIPATTSVHGTSLRTAKINFLCVHKKLRSKRVAPVLIREITRRVNTHGVFQAVYTAEVVLPKPIATCQFWHRSLKPKKLIETGYCYLVKNITLQKFIKVLELPVKPKCCFLRPLRKADIPAAHALLQQYLGKFKLRPEFDEAEFEHWFTPREGIVETYVVDRDGEVTDFISYYALPSTVVYNPYHKSIKAAYSFYNVATSMTLQELMKDALILAKNAGFDVFNALDVMDNKEFIETLKFGVGDRNLQYYVYNWRCPSVDPQEIGIVVQ